MTGVSILSAILALALGSCASAARNATKDALRYLPCPAPVDIYPCVCTVVEDHKMDMDCSLVESEDQLARIFSSDIPFTTFRRLVIMNNRHLKALRSEDLGVASFETIFIQGGILEEVLDQALSNSYSSATYIDLKDNRVSEFPFQELPLFTSLVSLKLSMNWLPDFPSLQSSVLQHIELDKNSFNNIPADGFTSLTNVETISCSNNHLQRILPGTFSDLPFLQELHLDHNQLSQIPQGAIAGFKGGLLNLQENSLKVLEEEVFRPFVQGGTTVALNGNPLSCGCDIAWLVVNGAFMDLISEGTTCSDGEFLSDLDPAIFQDLC
ncbi:oplophorus-luciferin 2-monooxygenase non-catalytic subunit-like [Penaeus indicus]|uniref:oplophorus-luciferin 2-monooxygenase non-catalytic subunit-like n=1 Tax=Penaeus indicus TaxID=29960 RepID=UPI00300C1F8F